jgi:serine/threonine protein kinase
MEDEDDSVLMAVRHAKTIQDTDDSELRDLLPSVDGILAGRVDGVLPRTSSNGSGDADRLPEQIGQYRIVERVGRGGMGTVYKALHTKLKRHVALKVVVSRRLSDPAAIARFHREMEAVGRLDHQNIVRAHDAGECDGRHFLITELLDGVNFSQLVRRHGPLSVSDACEAVREAAIGLEYAHGHGLIHRDVKPSNLMFTAGGGVKILDLGLARLSDAVSDEPESVGTAGDDDPDDDPDDDHDDDHATAADQILGSPAFMAPEQITDSRDVDGRADVFALGGTLFFLLTGETPFSRTKKDLLRNRRDEPDQIVSRLPSDLPPQLTSLLTRMLSRDRDDRPSDMAEVVKGLECWARRGDLESVARKVVDSDPEVARHSSHRKSTSSSSRRRSWIAAGLLVAASIAAWNWQAIVLRLTGQGEVVITGGAADLTIRLNGSSASRVIQADTQRPTWIKGGTYTITIEPADGRYHATPPRVVVHVGKQSTIHISPVPAPEEPDPLGETQPKDGRGDAGETANQTPKTETRRVLLRKEFQVSAKTSVYAGRPKLSRAANTGISVREGQEVRIAASGQWVIRPNEGPKLHFVKVAVGNVGQTLIYGCYVRGEVTSFTVPGDGYLFLGTSEGHTGTHDNSGSVVVRLEVRE